MMFSDGDITFFFVQHEDATGGWHESALDHFLFDGLSFDDKRGAVGHRYRQLLKQQGGNSALWQKYGVSGFVKREDADAVLAALRERYPDRKFRLVERRLTQTTEPVDQPITFAPDQRTTLLIGAQERCDTKNRRLGA